MRKTFNHAKPGLAEGQPDEPHFLQQWSNRLQPFRLFHVMRSRERGQKMPLYHPGLSQGHDLRCNDRSRHGGHHSCLQEVPVLD